MSSSTSTISVGDKVTIRRTGKVTTKDSSGFELDGMYRFNMVSGNPVTVEVVEKAKLKVGDAVTKTNIDRAVRGTIVRSYYGSVAVLDDGGLWKIAGVKEGYDGYGLVRELIAPVVALVP